MKDLKAIRGTRILTEMVAEGEHAHQDFKFAISDARKIARSISAFANNDGGRLLIGVKDNGTIAGVRNEEDIFVIEQAAERYCRPPQKLSFTAYRLEGHVRVIVAEIPKAETGPVEVVEECGTLKAYFRVADENIAAHPLMVRAWRIAAGIEEADPLDERHYALAALYADGSGPVDELHAAMALRISTDTASDLIARLVAADVLSYTFDGTHFILTS
ncbi:MAG: ATP-binding protein [Muribaculaceae bacterium]|nr:ATP-binding protein [Muribaculaceae bacterium]